MEFIYSFFATVFGYIMNFFFIVLDAIGLPYLWLCIVLFALTSRLISLPQKIAAARKKRLALTINYEMRKLRSSYGTVKKDDTERIKQYKKDTKAIFKKYKVSSGSGCLIALLQLPIFVGLFRVIKNPFEYVPQLSLLTESEKANVNDFLGLSLEALPQSFGALGIIVPTIVFFATLLRTAPALLNKTTRKQPALLILHILQPVLLTWMSFCFPIAISLYWTLNDIINLVISKIVDKTLDNNEEIKKTVAETEALLAAEKAEKEKAEQEKDNKSECVSSTDNHAENSALKQDNISKPTEEGNSVACC